MEKFDLFCIIYLALDADFDETHDKELGNYLMDADPFLFKEKTSAVKDVYEVFSSFIGDREVTTDNSFDLAKGYIKSLNIPAAEKSFSGLEREQWLEGVDQYLKEKCFLQLKSY